MEGQPVLVVNVDVVFVLNFVTDLAWLWATSTLAGVRVRAWRLGATAAAGAAAVVWAYFPGGRWLAAAPGVLLGTVVLAGLAFLPCRVNQAIRVGAYFLFTGGAMAGVVMLTSARQEGPPGLAVAGAWQFPPTLVATGLLLCLVGARYLWESARERSRFARGIYTLRVWQGGKVVELPALLDTGNSLKDPISGAPVAVVETEALGDLLPPLVRQAAMQGWEALDRLPGSWAVRCRMVPFRAVGRPAGILLAFAPDLLEVRAPGEQAWLVVHGLLGLAGERLHPEGSYRSLLPPLLLEALVDVSGTA